jgi:mono/diheme cytochrome c family protein
MDRRTPGRFALYAACAAALSSLSLTATAQEEADAVTRGKDAYAAKCVACHGRGGAGDGPAARALPKLPADLSASAFWESAKTSDIERAITDGIPGTVMRAYTMTPEQLSDLMTYLESLRTPSSP